MIRNNVSLIGRITKDVELRYTNTNKEVTNFVLAVNRTGSEETDFIDCVAWGKTAELMAKYVHKGHRIGISGRLTSRVYEKSPTEKRKIVEVVVDYLEFLEAKGKTENTPNNDFNDDEDDSGILGGITSDDLPF